MGLFGAVKVEVGLDVLANGELLEVKVAHGCVIGVGLVGWVNS